MTDAADSTWIDSGAEVLRAEHAGASYDADVSVVSDAIAERGGLRYVAHFTNGILDFAIGRPSLLATDAHAVSGDDAQVAAERAGRHFNFMVTHLGTACRPLESGPLIRVVAQGETGAVYHYLKFSGQNFFGITLDGSSEEVACADSQMTAIAEAATGRLGVQSLDWGGFRSRHFQAEQGDPADNAPAESTHAVIVRTSTTNSVANPQVQLCAEALDPAHLHYTAIFRKGQLEVCADIFEDSVLAPFFQKVTPEVRRAGYGELLRQVQLQRERLHQVLRTIGSHRLIRLVLDVAQGAIYFMPLNEDDFLVGVTLNQSRVEHADAEFRALHARITGSAP